MLLAFHKPYGVLSQFTPEPGSAWRTLAGFGFPRDVYPIGRLDADSEGLLLLGDEPALNARLLRPEHAHAREYWAQVERVPTAEALRALERGVVIRGHRTLTCRARRLEPPPDLPPRDPPIRVRRNIPDGWIALELTEGKNRQVRRMTAAVGHPTLRLVRVRIGGLELRESPGGRASDAGRTGAAADFRGCTAPCRSVRTHQAAAARRTLISGAFSTRRTKYLAFFVADSIMALWLLLVDASVCRATGRQTVGRTGQTFHRSHHHYRNQTHTMLQHIRKSRGGFTLVEIMIVVAIIALLAAIAVPGFLRSRKRSQATAILNDARIISGAIDQYAIESNQIGSATVQIPVLKGYFKPASRLYSQAPSGTLYDILTTPYVTSTFDAGVRVASSTETNFSDVIDNPSSFWGSYY